MRRSRIAALAALALSAVGFVPAQAAPAPAPALAGTTVVTGSAMVAMTVRLPSPVTVDLHAIGGAGSRNDIEIAGNGRMVGLVLSQGGTLHRAPDREIWMTRDNICMRRGCQATGDGIGYFAVAFGTSTQPADGTYRIPAGTYRLALLADGAPVTVTLRLHGLPGATTLRPTRSSHATQLESPPQVGTVDEAGVSARSYRDAWTGYAGRAAEFVNFVYVWSNDSHGQVRTCMQTDPGQGQGSSAPCPAGSYADGTPRPFANDYSSWDVGPCVGLCLVQPSSPIGVLGYLSWSGFTPLDGYHVDTTAVVTTHGGSWSLVSFVIPWV
jgi:hypothetical protein